MEKFRNVILEAESIGVSNELLPDKLLEYASSEKYLLDRVRSAFLLGMAWERVGVSDAIEPENY